MNNKYTRIIVLLIIIGMLLYFGYISGFSTASLSVLIASLGFAYVLLKACEKDEDNSRCLMLLLIPAESKSAVLSGKINAELQKLKSEKCSVIDIKIMDAQKSMKEAFIFYKK